MQLGYEIGKTLPPGSFLALNGELGSGKTVFTKGIAKALGVKEYRYVNSPTFVIIKEYAGRMPLYHFDLYRLGAGHDLDTVGYEDYFYGSGVAVVEWADKIRALLPRERLEITFAHAGGTKRRIRVKANDENTRY